MSAQFSPNRNRALIAVMLAVTALVAACDRPTDVAAPGDLTPQMAPGGSTTTVRFFVAREDAPGVGLDGATVSVYYKNGPLATEELVPCTEVPADTYRNCWATTKDGGFVDVAAPTGVGIGFLGRVLQEDWIEAGNQVWPPAAPPSGALSQANSDLGALTCGRNRPVNATPGSLKLCFDNLYFTPRGTVERVDLVLPVVNSRSVIVRDLEGNVISGSDVYAYLIEPLGFKFPWQDLPSQVDPGFLRFYGASSGPGVSLPKIKGNLEVYGKSPKGYEVAASKEVGENESVDIQALPVVCTSPALADSLYKFPARPLNAEFAFSEGKWVFGANRIADSDDALDPNLTTTVVVLKVQYNTTSPVTVTFSQRLRTSGGTNTASGAATCTAGGCTVQSATAPGAGNPMLPSLFYQQSTGRLFWVVAGLIPDGDSEWTVKATKQSGKKDVVLDQWPVPDKSTSSSAFQTFDNALKTAFCDPRPEWSYDGGWGCGI